MALCLLTQFIMPFQLLLELPIACLLVLPSLAPEWRTEDVNDLSGGNKVLLKLSTRVLAAD